MELRDWLRPLVAGVLGLVVKLFDIAYQEFRRRSERSEAAKRFVDEHLDPLLKAADELVGKLLSLAREDFKTFQGVDPNAGRQDNNDFTSLVFLIAKWWAYIEIIRREGLSVSLVEDERGRSLQSFIDCSQSRGVRIVDRISQRAVGELMLTQRKDGTSDTLLFIEFTRLLNDDTEARMWLSPLTHMLSRIRHTTERQRLLRYGIVIHAMIDTLDPEHHVTRDRPSYPDKLSKKTWNDLRYRVFGRYLKFIPDTKKYLGPPKKRRPQKV